MKRPRCAWLSYQPGSKRGYPYSVMNLLFDKGILGYDSIVQ